MTSVSVPSNVQLPSNETRATPGWVRVKTPGVGVGVKVKLFPLLPLISPAMAAKEVMSRMVITGMKNLVWIDSFIMIAFDLLAGCVGQSALTIIPSDFWWKVTGKIASAGSELRNPSHGGLCRWKPEREGGEKAQCSPDTSAPPGVGEMNARDVGIRRRYQAILFLVLFSVCVGQTSSHLLSK